MIKARNGRILSESIKLLLQEVPQSKRASEKIKWRKRDRPSLTVYLFMQSKTRAHMDS